MMTSAEVLAALDERRIKNTAISELLKLDTGSVSRLRAGNRRLLFDEGVTLIRHFGLDGGEPAPPRQGIGSKLDRIIALLERNADA